MKMRFLTMWAGSVLDTNITQQSFRYQDENAGICFATITRSNITNEMRIRYKRHLSVLTCSVAPFPPIILPILHHCQ